MTTTPDTPAPALSAETPFIPYEKTPRSSENIEDLRLWSLQVLQEDALWPNEEEDQFVVQAKENLRWIATIDTLRAQIAEKDAEVERTEKAMYFVQNKCLELDGQLAAAQKRSEELQGAVNALLETPASDWLTVLEDEEVAILTKEENHAEPT